MKTADSLKWLIIALAAVLVCTGGGDRAAHFAASPGEDG